MENTTSSVGQFIVAFLSGSDRLIDPRNGQTFYVGKGKGNRLYAHINDTLKNFDGKSYIDKDEDEIAAKIKQIREIRTSGL